MNDSRDAIDVVDSPCLRVSRERIFRMASGVVLTESRPSRSHRGAERNSDRLDERFKGRHRSPCLRVSVRESSGWRAVLSSQSLGPHGATRDTERNSNKLNERFKGRHRCYRSASRGASP
jgi:hypothetical protein